MANLSSNTLFHFTRSLDAIIDIMQNGFKYGFLSERIISTNVAYFVNEICFCNIPLSMINEHCDWYGRYAIGLKRNIAREKGITPVFYVHSKTPFLPKSYSQKTLDFFNSFSLTYYLKNDRGEQFNIAAGTQKKKNFYDEKEWKIVHEDGKAIEHFQNNETLYERKEQLKETNSTDDRLTIEIDDIEYIILGKKTDLPSFSVFIDNHFPDKKDDILTKIIFYTQIHKDF